ncbi:MAG: hypothetical protein H6622_01905 [Halobacteriovoraceae bacterium]|nr:hypothetical protein [Halobacteriovoraceae bacterium]
MTNRNSPSFVRTLSIKGFPSELVISKDGTKGFLTTDGNGLVILDLTDPTNPKVQ